ncbi:MAG: hypothetical protein JWR68_3394 [Polaromonas sp.]|nr:hypothetical protein [Polaromonas sp.]
MSTGPSFHSMNWLSGMANKRGERKESFLSTFAPFIYFFAGFICAALALPLGMTAAALIPVLIGFIVEICAHFMGREAKPENLAWTIAGSALFVTTFKLTGLA